MFNSLKQRCTQLINFFNYKIKLSINNLIKLWHYLEDIITSNWFLSIFVTIIYVVINDVTIKYQISFIEYLASTYWFYDLSILQTVLTTLRLLILMWLIYKIVNTAPYRRQ